MKAIPTIFKKIKFRSRTEARWAVFFENMKWNWEYEPQGYVLPRNIAYLPDFKVVLPDGVTLYAEVKAFEFDDLGDEQIRKARLLASETKATVVLLPGTPECRIYNAVTANSADNTFIGTIFQDYEPYLRVADSYWLAQATLDPTNGRMKFDFDERKIRKAFGDGYAKALEASRSARFEHGESPS